MELVGRLKKIASLIEPCTLLADVGCDHGYIPIECVRSGIAKSALAMDVNPQPLERCTDNVAKYNLSHKIETRLSNGIEALEYGEADCIVVAGMGGLLIRDILCSNADKIAPGTKLILQPMIAQMELREYLYNADFEVTNEYVVREEDKFYNIICVKKAKKRFLSDEIDFNLIAIGKNLKNNSKGDFKAYCDYKISVERKILSGLNKAINPDYDEINRHQRILDEFLKEEN